MGRAQVDSAAGHDEPRQTSYRGSHAATARPDPGGSGRVRPHGRRPHRRQHRPGHRRQARHGPHRRRRPARRGSPADRGRPRRRQDQVRQGARPLDRLLGAARPVHPGPAAERRHRRERLQRRGPRLRVQARPGVREHRGRRRDQPRLAEDAVGAARVHGRTSGHRRRRHLRPRVAVPRARHAEPDRHGGHLPAARGAARPVHRAHLDGLPRPARRDPDARRARRARPARLAAPGLRRAARCAR